ncbi:Amidase [Phytophthora palmivora]|uniref:Amidase n=1 Tax=Phytophthora palmivora TaxID=4796 RepID=A0A2P4YHI3_9STRA|nr:Amidase [Phytophthora palmivora]
MAISEAEEEEERHSMLLESGRGDPNAGAERYDEIYDRIMKIRETLDISSSDFDAVLESIGHNDPARPSDPFSDRLDSDLAFSFSEGAGSEDPSALDGETSVQSLDHQEAGELLPSPTPEEESAVEEARALEEAMQWNLLQICT